MEIEAINQLVNTALGYQQYLQELNAKNLAAMPNAQHSQLSLDFNELLDIASQEQASGPELRRILEENTTSLAAPANLDQISVASQIAKGRYAAVAEGYTRVLSIYRVAIGKE